MWTTLGKNVYVVNTLGVAACYDLDGNRKWIKLITQYGEHGKLRDKYNTQFWCLASPLVIGDTLYINRSGLAALEKETGKEKWYVAELYGKGMNPYEGNPGKAYYSQYQISSPVAGKAGNEDVLWAGPGTIVRARDGKILWTSPNLDGNMPSPAFADGAFYSLRNVVAMPAKADGDKFDCKVTQASLGGLTSVTVQDGLIYHADYTGELAVTDARTLQAVYKKALPLKPLLAYFTIGVGSTAEANGQGNLFVMDNQGYAVVFKAGREYKQVALNKIEHFVHRRCQAPQQESLQSIPLFDGKNIFIRSEENVYCIGQK